MKPSRFEYHAPERVDEAVGLLAEHGSEAKVLAGGQSLVPIMAIRLSDFGHLVDINEVSGIDSIERVDDSLRVGSIVRQAAAASDAIVAEHAPLLAQAIPHIGHFQIRNRGTIGGSIAHADPASELPAVALTLGATIETASKGGGRQIAAADFFESSWSTTIEDQEMVTAIHFPIWSGNTGFAVEEISRRHGDFALVGAAVGVELDGDTIKRAGISLFGVGSTAVRAEEAEAALIAGGVNSDLTAVGREAAAPLNPNADLHASTQYRKDVAAVVVRRALEKAIKEAQA